MPARYWEPGFEEIRLSDAEIEEAEEWLEENGMPYDEELPFN